MSDIGEQDGLQADALREENERLRSELERLKASLRISSPHPDGGATTPTEWTEALILMPDPASRTWDWRGLSRLVLEHTSKAMPDYRWSTVHDLGAAEPGTVVLHFTHVWQRLWGSREETGVPAYEITEEGELKRAYVGDLGREAFRATFLMEHALEFYAEEHADLAPIIREAYRLAGILTRASLELMRAEWENGDDEGDSNWRATYADWQASEKRFLAWMQDGAAGAREDA